MTKPRLMIVGNFSATCHVGAMLGRAAETLGVPWHGVDSDYARSIRTLPGRAFFRLSGGRPLEWWRYHGYLWSRIQKFKPNFIIVTGVFPLSRRLFARCRAAGIVVANLATDDPWARHMRHNTYFRGNIREYDLVVSTKSGVVGDFKRHGARHVEWFTYAYDPSWHRPPDPVSAADRESYLADVSFIGTGNRDRKLELEELARLVPGTHRLYGNSWAKPPAGWVPMGEALDNRFRLAVHEAKVCLALLRKGSRDDSTQRTYEIAPCHGCGIYEDTAEHRSILASYPEIGFFKSPSDLARSTQTLLAKPALRQELRERGIQILVRPENTFASRLRSMIDWAGLRLSADSTLR